MMYQVIPDALAITWAPRNHVCHVDPEMIAEKYQLPPEFFYNGESPETEEWYTHVIEMSLERLHGNGHQ